MQISKKFDINGVEQWLYVNRVPKAKGTLFFLHGGPGWSDAPLAPMICKSLWNDFNTIHWDQRGTNRSYVREHKPDQLSVDLLVRDGLKIIERLKEDAQLGRIVLVGHSWGSLLGVLMAKKAPELFHSFVGIGQLVSNAMSEPISLEFCKSEARRLAKADLLAELSKMGSDFYKDVPTLFRQREILFELGGEFAGEVTSEAFQNWVEGAPLQYRTNWKLMFETCEFSMNLLWHEVISYDLLKDFPSLELPICIIQGRRDFVTPGQVAEAWFNKVSAPKKEFVWFENSGHWPQLEENGKFARLLTALVLV